MTIRGGSWPPLFMLDFKTVGGADFDEFHKEPTKLISVAGRSCWQ